MKSLRIKYIILSMFYLMMSHFMVAQNQQDRRTLQTRIADVLAKFPANDAQQFEKLMEEMASLGEEGIIGMAGLINPPGKGDNTKIYYALSGLSFYANTGTREALRETTSRAYIQAMEKEADADIRAFIISQIQIVGKGEVVPHLEKYLKDGDLCDPAARALIKINDPSARKTLISALPAAQGNCQYAIIGALGDVRTKDAVEELLKQVSNNDKHAQKLALYALANIGDPSSEAILEREAKTAGYILSDNNAMASYLLWARRMTEAGNTKQVEKIAKSLIKRLNQENQVHSRIAALKLLVDIKGNETTATLLEAAKDKNPEYRGAALRFATNLEGEKVTKQWVTQYNKASNEAKPAIISMLSNRNDQAAYSVIQQALDSKEPAVKLAAIKAASNLGGEKAIPKLLQLVKNADAKQAEAIKTSLLSIKSKEMESQFPEIMQESNSFGKAALLEVLGRRNASEYGHLALSYANEQDTIVRRAALMALKEVSKQDDLTELYILLSKANTDAEALAIQLAINAALGEQGQEEKTAAILQQISEATPDKKHYYYNVLADIGGDKALEAVLHEYSQGEVVGKKAAIDALSNWSDFAGRKLLDIAKASQDDEEFDQALTGYIRQIRKHNDTPANKYLLLREGMKMARTSKQKQMIIQEMGRNPSFPALMYVGRFLDEPEVKDQAIYAVMNIATSSKEFYGSQVREMLKKVIDGLQGQESAYLKEAVQKHLDELPKDQGFVPIFNEKDLTGWKGYVTDPINLSKMNVKALQREQKKADEAIRKTWIVEDGKLIFTGKGENILTDKKYGDIEMYVDWKLQADAPDGDAGIYLRGTPQVQIWDTSRVDVGAEVGSGGLYNNKIHESKPLKVTDNPLGEWNTFRIIMEGEKVTVYLNGEKVVDDVLENYWDPGQPVFPEGTIELQAHGTRVEYRDIYVRELNKGETYSLSNDEEREGYQVLFDGTDLRNFVGATNEYEIENGNLLIRKDKKGNLFTKDQYSDFIFRFEFQLTPGANNGLAIRAPMEGDPAYGGMEIQILDNDAPIYKDLKPYQYHGSVYGIIPAERGHLKPVGEWNYQEVHVEGPKVKIILNGKVILDGDLEEATKNGTLDGENHPGLKRKSGHIGFLGHESEVRFRNIRVRDLSKKM